MCEAFHTARSGCCLRCAAFVERGATHATITALCRSRRPSSSAEMGQGLFYFLWCADDCYGGVGSLLSGFAVFPPHDVLCRRRERGNTRLRPRVLTYGCHSSRRRQPA